MTRNTTKAATGSVPTPRQSRIPLVHLEELAAIWDTDKRMPSPPSRRAWAQARRLRPEQVNNWFYRKKTAARKSGIVLPDDTYELPVGIPPTLLNDQSLPPSSPPIPETPITMHSDPICVKKEDPYCQEERAAALLSDDSVYAPTHISSGSSDAPGSLTGHDDNRCDNGFGGSRFSTRSAGTRTPLTPAEPSCFFSADAPYIVQQRSYYNAGSRGSENRAYISYTPSIPWSHSVQDISSSVIQAKCDPEDPSCFSSYFSAKDSQLRTHDYRVPPVSSSIMLPRSVYMPPVPATPTFFPVSQPIKSPQTPSLTGPAQPGAFRYEERIQMLRSLNYDYDIEEQIDRSNEPNDSPDGNATNTKFKQGDRPRLPSCKSLLELDANSDPPYTNLDSSTAFAAQALPPQAPSSPPPSITPARSESPVQKPERLYLPAEDSDIDELKQEQYRTRIMRDPNTFSWCLGGKRYSYDGFFIGICECWESDGADVRDVQLKFKRYAGCTGPW